MRCACNSRISKHMAASGDLPAETEMPFYVNSRTAELWDR